MKYFYDTEFLEGTQKRFFGKTQPTIDLISIGIVAEDGREYYAISKDFNLKEAWNRFDLKEICCPIDGTPSGRFKKEYWIRDNVLRPIFNDLQTKSFSDPTFIRKYFYSFGNGFTYDHFKDLIKHYGKSREEIAQDVFEFCTEDTLTIEKAKYYNKSYDNIDLYGYYSAYDHVALCWLFGKMLDLPKGFPMYTRDLKQMFDEVAEKIQITSIPSDINAEEYLKQKAGYPELTNEHDALADARWNKKLYEFITSITP